MQEPFVVAAVVVETAWVVAERALHTDRTGRQ
jgi:hypothetical protein